MESKKKEADRQGSLITVVALVTSFIAFIGGFVLSEDINPKKVKVLKSENSDVVIAAKGLNDSLKFDEKNVNPKKGNLSYNLKTTYYGIDDDSYYTINHGVNDDELEFTKYYSGERVSSEIISFDSNVVDIVVNYLNDDEKEDYVAFILENGNVEYMRAKKEMNDVTFSYKMSLPLLDDIVKYYQGVSCNSETSKCYNDIYVQSSNGTIYSVNEYVY